ncbi:uncharacterized protein LOC125662505 [Ostrea edulis]|uniref:uncharacterized protein LOC125662505 n=1 Tax=Ostrea edulis TaxID=37623 RepID=UPI0024AFB697|nr:uncharacterized protein LOC125662505 [Ostrea edulis]
MHPWRSAQDVLLCNLCDNTSLQSHCDLCHVDLCPDCVEKHISDESRRHNVVPFPHRKYTPHYSNCLIHVDEQCKHHCEKCDIPVCSTCVSSGIHESHDISDILNKISSKTERLHSKAQVASPSFPPQKPNKVHNNEMFGSLSPLPLTTKYHNRRMDTPKASSTSVRPLSEEPRLITTIYTGYTPRSVACLSEEKIWTCGFDKVMKLLNLHGKLLASIQTESGYIPGDIAVTRDGDLVYTDNENKSVNLVKNKRIQTVITLQGWTPRYVCSTSSGDFLVIIVSNDATQSQVVRYSGSTEKQTIQFDDQGHPLYSPDRYFTKYICENRNMDICVADWIAKAVVVVNQSGKFRFRYTGHPSNIEQSFNPAGITTDSQSHILTADVNRIHILDQDGQFLLHIDKCGLRAPLGLCVDVRDNLFVAEYGSVEVKKLQYL